MCFGSVFGGSAEVRGISVPDQIMDEREVHHLVDLSEQVVLRDNPVIEVVATDEE